jgi:hypothetical protein
VSAEIDEMLRASLLASRIRQRAALVAWLARYAV